MKLLLALFEASFMLAAACGWGRLLLGRFPQKLGRWPDRVLQAAVGLGLIAYATLAAAALGLIRLPFFLLLLLGGNILLWRLPKEAPPGGEKRSGRPSLPLLLLVLLAAINLFYSLFPPTFYDSMLYHLALPAYYLQHGSIAAWPTNYYAYLPHTGEMLYLFGLLGKSIYLPKLISFAGGILLVVWLATWIRSGSFSSLALMPALLIYSIPEVGFLASSSKTDIFGLLFVAIATRLLLGEGGEKPPRGTVILSGLFFGLALATKYTFAFPLAGVSASLLLTPGRPLSHKIKTLAVLAACVILVMAPWLVRNAVLTGNPCYPYFSGIFPTATWSGSQAANLSRVLKRGSDWGVGRILRFPIEMFTAPYRHGMTAVEGILLLLCLPFLLFGRPDDRERFLLTAAFFSYGLLLFFARVPRYFLPAFIFLAVPMAGAMRRVWEQRRHWRAPLAIGLALAASVNLALQVSLQERFSFGIRFATRRFAARRITGAPPGGSAAYLEFLPYYGAAKFINRSLLPTDRVAFLGEERTFYVNRPFLVSSFGDRSPVLDSFRASRTPEDFFESLRRSGVTHILYSASGLARMALLSPHLYTLTEAERGRLEDFLARATPLYSDRNYRLLRIE